MDKMRVMYAADSLVEGVGNEVFYLLFVLAAFFVPLFFFCWQNRHRALQAIHPAHRAVVDEVRRQLGRFQPSAHVDEGDGTATNQQHAPPQVFSDYETCPICLNPLQYAVLANCGHVFCTSCILAYWRYTTWPGAVNCPVCRNQITLLLQSFREADPNVPERAEHLVTIRDYNRRFSGHPRPIMDYIRDIPVLLPHLARQFFSMNGLMFMFRVRIMMCFAVAVLYLLSPLDIIPEAVFGIVGVLDDLFVLLLFAVYLAIAYRRFIVGE